MDSVVRIGSQVRVRYAEGGTDGDKEFALVHPAKADATQHRVSTESPLGRAARAPGGRAGQLPDAGRVMAVTLVGIR